MKMFRNTISLLLTLSIGIASSQQYNSVIIEKENIDTNNKIYKVGSVFIYDYEIFEGNDVLKLKLNTRTDFKITSMYDSARVKKIHLIVKPTNEGKRTNSNQTQITYFQDPVFNAILSTGVVENDSNVWLHPIRYGFFKSLETCPFPYVKKPIQIGNEWSDKMRIGAYWGHEKWGEWKNKLALNYHYKVKTDFKLATELGLIDCYIIESYARSEIGTSKLLSFYSPKYGFIRLEYTLFTGIQIIFKLIDFKENQEFKSDLEFIKTKNYIKD